MLASEVSILHLQILVQQQQSQEGQGREGAAGGLCHQAEGQL